MPEGYKTNVGERGVLLSGGQKQRIGIARALYKKSNIIIFDEATSALDSITTEKIINNIDNSFQNNTIIMISHNLKSLQRCDYILKIKKRK